MPAAWTEHIVRAALTGSRRLGALAERHGITFPAHDADADALASLRLLHITAGIDEVIPHVGPRTLHRLQERWHDRWQRSQCEKAIAEQRDFTPAYGWPIALGGAA